MSDYFFHLIERLNIVQLIAIGIMIWFFYNRLDNRIDRLDKIFYTLSQEVKDLDHSLCRIEGSLSSHGHCLLSLLKQGLPDRKAE